MTLAPLWPIRILLQELTILDLLSAGRAIAGLGLGYADFDFQAMQVDRSQRSKILRKEIDELIGAWRHGKPLSDGRPLAPMPVQQGGPALMLGGGADAALRRAARYGDIFFGDANFDYRLIVPKWRKLEALCEDGKKPMLVLGTFLWVTEDEEFWKNELSPAIAYQLSRYRQWQIDEAARPRDYIKPESLDRDGFLVGSPDALVEKLVALFREIPIECICLWGRPPGVSRDAAFRNVERLSQKVMPKVLRELGRSS
jgi:alkanesulfonate monooxygenase SsuD/methylene tetrahydromethanopterin reductase-like flavin-dependent oxidoreductase (luciferase family)